jgi:hypothetical protein
MKTENLDSTKHKVRYLVCGLALVAIATLVIARPFYRSSAASGAAAAQKELGNEEGQRRLWSDPTTFEMLSGAARTALEAKFGRLVEGGTKPVVPAPGAQGQSKDKVTSEAGSEDSVLSALTNPLVNDPTTDATAQKTQSETTIVLGSSSNVIGGFNDSGSFVGGAQKFTGYSTSSDSGATWTDKGTLPTNANGDAGDPVLARNTTTGRIYLITLNFTGAGLRLFRSDNDGATFLAPVNPGPGVGASDVLDKEWITVDNFGGSGNGNVYNLVRNFVGGGNSGGVFLFRSTDNGDTWGPSGGTLIAGAGSFNVQGAFVAVGLDHSVYAFWLDQSAGSGTANILKVRRSTDQGVTFGTAATIATLNTTGVNGSLGSVGGFRTNAFCHAAVNPVNGNVYVVYDDINAPAPTDNGDVYFRQSTNSGATWSASTKLNTDVTTNLNWSPTLAVTPDGTKVGVFWYDRRRDPSNAKIESWGRIGTISGASVTFGFDFCISNASFPAVFGQDPVVNSVYMGDYDMAAADNSFFYTTWGDNRLASAPDVRFAKISVAGPGPEIAFSSAAISGGNGDGVVQPDECNNLSVTISNCGSAAATGISATLATSTSGVTVVDATQPYADIAPGASGTNAIPFKVSTSPSFVCGTTINFMLTVSYAGGPDIIQFNVPSGGEDYVFSTSSLNSIMPGTTDIGNHGDDVTTSIALPFSYTFYGSSFGSAIVSSNGNLQLVGNSTAFSNACLPTPALNMAIIPHWDDLRTDIVAGTGIFTSTSGVAPNRIFNIEWRASYFSGAGGANFEIRLFEGQQRVDFIYGTVDQTGAGATVGVQKDTGSRFTQFECNTGGIASGLGVSFTLPPCAGGGGECVTCTVPDTQLPTITCPVNISRNTRGNKCVIVTYAPTFSDNCPGTTVTCSPASGFCFPVGTTTVTCTATDASGNTATCPFTVTVVKQRGGG